MNLVTLPSVNSTSVLLLRLHACTFQCCSLCACSIHKIQLCKPLQPRPEEELVVILNKQTINESAFLYFYLWVRSSVTDDEKKGKTCHTYRHTLSMQGIPKMFTISTGSVHLLWEKIMSTSVVDITFCNFVFGPLAKKSVRRYHFILFCHFVFLLYFIILFYFILFCWSTAHPLNSRIRGNVYFLPETGIECV